MLSAAGLLRSLAASRLAHWNIAASVLMVVCWATATSTVPADSLAELFNTEVTQHVAELILAMLLFVVATEARWRPAVGSSPGLAARVLLIAMPLSIAGRAARRRAPAEPLLAAAPVDRPHRHPSHFAAAKRVVRDPGLPAPVRGVLDFESGYNDGLVSPVFPFALILARTDNEQNTAEDALATATATALPFAIKAIVMDAGTGALVGILHSWPSVRA